MLQAGAEVHESPVRALKGTLVPCCVFDSNRQVARYVAKLVADLVRQKNAAQAPAVLGLPTGSTPVGVYRELIRMHRNEGLDFSHVVTFNLDEYFGLQPTQLQSYHRWMHEHFFDHVNIARENIHIPDGAVPLDRVDEHCRQYEDAIRKAGGIDLMLLGVGRNGHIGFNEPFSARHSRTRLATLDPVTRKSAASDFFSEDAVPLQAITMGVATILEAKKILLIALGEQKAAIIREAVEGATSSERVPAAALREHPDATFLLDEASAAVLTDVATPWVLGNVEWHDALIKRAVIWLCQQRKKALLKLADSDFRAHNLHQLVRHHGPAQRLAQRVFDWLMQTIAFHPGGMKPRRVLCFSPHPDDDVISMGGTLIRLCEDGHEVHVAYMTSGNIAVFDHDARRAADLVAEYNRLFGIDREKSLSALADVDRSLKSKTPGQADIPCVLQIKALIRWGEAKAGAMFAGCREEDLHFLDLPFYQTGTIAKRPIGAADIKIVRKLIERLQPEQIYMAGDLSDPHGTHRLCAETIIRAIQEIDATGGKPPEVLLYRGAWQEWAAHEIDIAVPLRPDDIERKRAAIFCHESQKDRALFPGPDDPREFWQRAEDRNRHTADVYNQLGLPEYFAIEGFVRWNGAPI